MIEIPSRQQLEQHIDPTRACIVLEPSSSSKHAEARRSLAFRATRSGLSEDQDLPAPKGTRDAAAGVVRIEQTLKFHIDDACISRDGVITVKQSFELGGAPVGPSVNVPKPRPPLVAQTNRSLWLRGPDALAHAQKLVQGLEHRLGHAAAVPVYRLPGGGQWYTMDPWIVDFRVREGELPKELYEYVDIEKNVKRFGGKWLTGRFKKPETDPYAFAQRFYRLVGEHADLGLRSMPMVIPLASAPPDFYYTVGPSGSPPGQKANLDTINAESMWSRMTARASVSALKPVKVFLLDVGVNVTVDSQIDSLSASVIGVTSGPPYPTDTLPPIGGNCHGTQMTGIIDADWTFSGPPSMAGICGDCPEIAVVSIKCTSLAEIALGVDYAAWCITTAATPTKGVVVIGHDVLQFCAQAKVGSPALQADLCKFENSLKAAEASPGPDLLVIMPAGNFVAGDPASIPDVIAINPATLVVGATNAPPDQATRWALSRYANPPTGVKPALAAPGEFVNSVQSTGVYALDSGTSFAAAHVAGVAALMRCANSSLSATQVASLLQSTATPIATPVEVGAGRLNGDGAVAAALAPPPVPMPVPSTS